MLIAMNNYIYTYTYACRIITTTQDERHSSLEKYTSHFIERVRKGYSRFYCERELETEQNCNILTPTLLAITAFLSRSPVLLNRGPGGPASLGAGFLYRILSPTDWTSFAPSYIIVRRPPSSCGRYKSHSFNPCTVKVIFWYSLTGCTGAFPILTARPGRRSIYNTKTREKTRRNGNERQKGDDPAKSIDKIG